MIFETTSKQHYVHHEVENSINIHNHHQHIIIAIILDDDYHFMRPIESLSVCHVALIRRTEEINVWRIFAYGVWCLSVAGSAFVSVIITDASFKVAIFNRQVRLAIATTTKGESRGEPRTKQNKNK